MGMVLIEYPKLTVSMVNPRVLHSWGLELFMYMLDGFWIVPAEECLTNWEQMYLGVFRELYFSYLQYEIKFSEHT